MTTKKKAQGGSKDKAAEKARAIVRDVCNSYDVRLKLARALRDFEAGKLDRPAETLARMVAQAEAGCVVEAPGDEIGEDWEGAGHSAERFIETAEIPDWLRSAMCEAVNAAARLHRIEVWKEFPEALGPDSDYDGQGYSAAALGELFRVSQMTQFDDLPGQSLADHIAAVLKHPDTPRDLYDGMRRAIATMTEPDDVNEHPDVLRIALAVAKAEQAEEGGE